MLRTFAGACRQGCEQLAKASDRRRITGYLPRFQMRLGFSSWTAETHKLKVQG